MLLQPAVLPFIPLLLVLVVGVVIFLLVLRHRLPRRMAPWLWVSLTLAGIIALLAPQQLPLSLYKLSLVASAAWMGYWIDRSLFPYGRPDIYTEQPASPGLPVPRYRQVRANYLVAYAASMLRRVLGLPVWWVAAVSVMLLLLAWLAMPAHAQSVPPASLTHRAEWTCCNPLALCRQLSCAQAGFC